MSSIPPSITPNVNPSSNSLPNFLKATGAASFAVGFILNFTDEALGLTDSSRIYTSGFLATFGVILFGAGYLLTRTSQTTVAPVQSPQVVEKKPSITT